MIDKNASDLHITTGSPPQLRIDGSMVPLKVAPLNGMETKQLCYSVLTEEQKITFEKHNELDLSFGVKNLARFRANIFMQRGAVAGALATTADRAIRLARIFTATTRPITVVKAISTKNGAMESCVSW